MTRVLVCDELAPNALEALRARGLEVEEALKHSPAELLTRVRRGYDAILVRSATKISAEIIQATPGLKLIGRAGVGIDNVDVEAATRRGVLVINAPASNTTATAELTLGLIFALARHLVRAERTTRGASWDKKALLGTELAGSTLGVIGLGRIGRAVALRAHALSMRVLGYDPHLTQNPPHIACVSLERLLSESDFVTLHVPYSDSTHHLLSRERLLAMKRGARLINCARGGLIDEQALLECLQSGQIGAAALDVLEQEPPSAQHPLLGREDVLVTPHIGASTRQAQAAVSLELVEGVLAFFLENRAVSPINAAPGALQAGWAQR
jgi:D-3-phosphoglycerate dehydrogenase